MEPSPSSSSSSLTPSSSSAFSRVAATSSSSGTPLRALPGAGIERALPPRGMPPFLPHRLPLRPEEQQPQQFQTAPQLGMSPDFAREMLEKLSALAASRTQQQQHMSSSLPSSSSFSSSSSSFSSMSGLQLPATLPSSLPARLPTSLPSHMLPLNSSTAAEDEGRSPAKRLALDVLPSPRPRCNTTGGAVMRVRVKAEGEDSGTESLSPPLGASPSTTAPRSRVSSFSIQHLLHNRLNDASPASSGLGSSNHSSNEMLNTPLSLSTSTSSLCSLASNAPPLTTLAISTPPAAPALQQPSDVERARLATAMHAHMAAAQQHQQQLQQFQNMMAMGFSPFGFGPAAAAMMAGGYPPVEREICAVCDDRASGYHYGVLSCEGCKGFFRRSVQKAEAYECMKFGRCDVNRATRNRCQACRLKKCLAKGMAKESVKQDRRSGNQKRKLAAEEERERKERELTLVADTMAAIGELTTAYTNAFPAGSFVASDEDAHSRLTFFIGHSTLLCDAGEQPSDAAARALMRAMCVRAALTEDGLACLPHLPRERIERLRALLRPPYADASSPPLLSLPLSPRLVAIITAYEIAMSAAFPSPSTLASLSEQLRVQLTAEGGERLFATMALRLGQRD